MSTLRQILASHLNHLQRRQKNRQQVAGQSISMDLCLLIANEVSALSLLQSAEFHSKIGFASRAVSLSQLGAHQRGLQICARLSASIPTHKKKRSNVRTSGNLRLILYWLRKYSATETLLEVCARGQRDRKKMRTRQRAEVTISRAEDIRLSWRRSARTRTSWR